MDADARELRLVEDLYRASIEPARWERFAQTFSDCAEGAGVTVAIRRSGTRTAWDYFGAGAEVAVLVAERLHEGLDHAVESADFHSDFVSLGDAFPDVDLEGSGFFRDWLRPRSFAPTWPLCHAVTVDRQIQGWVLVQPVDEGSFDRASFLTMGSRLIPHLARAFRILHEIGASNHERRALEEVVDRLPVGVILIDAGRRVIQTNLSAERMLALDGELQIVDGRLRANPEDDVVLQNTIDETIEAASSGAFDRMSRVALTSRSDRRPFQLSLTPLLRALPGSPMHDAVAAVFFGSPDAITQTSVEALEAVYGLTAAESAIVQGLVAGKTIEEVAAHRKVKTVTARGQLKEVFAKTGTGRQAELIRLVLTGVSPLSQSFEPRENASS